MIFDRLELTRTTRDLLDTAESVFGDYPGYLTASGETVSEVSFRDYIAGIRRMSAHLLRKFGPKKIVALPGSLTREWLYVFLGLTYAGSIAVPLDMTLGSEETLKKLGKLSPDVLLCEEAYPSAAERLRSAFPEVYGGTIEELWREVFSVSQTETEGPAPLQNRSEVCAEVFPPQDPEDTAMLIFTSGTTGENKIVEITHRNACADGYLATVYVGDEFVPGTRLMVALPMYHMYGITSAAYSVFYRALTLCLGSLRTLKKDLQVFRPNMLTIVPMIVYNFARNLFPSEGTPETDAQKEARIRAGKEYLGGCLRLIIAGGAPLSPVFIDYFSMLGVFLMNGYGITECSPVVSCDAPFAHRTGTVGRPGILPEISSVKLVDGEICVKGEIVSPGYWREPELNRLVYDEDGWFYTGDLGQMDEDGFMTVTGRKKNILVLPDGNNISLEELETGLCGCPEVDSAIVFAKTEHGSLYLEAVIYPVSGNGKTAEEQREAIDAWICEMNRSCSRYKRIASFRVVSEPFEKTALGKIRKFLYQN